LKIPISKKFDLEMATTTDRNEKIQLIQDALIERFPEIKSEFDRKPDLLEKILSLLPIEISWKRSKEEPTPDETEIVQKDFCPEVLLFFKYLDIEWESNVQDNSSTYMNNEALSIFQKNREKFPSIKKEYIEELLESYGWHNENRKRSFCSNLLKIMFNNRFNKNVSAIKLFNMCRKTKSK
jgi:hypothetical protein